ncbi:hypothetical protein R1sor_012374 [Riccia sorocarpa]|uniref:Uncharacterized protein n=1 Tax=Riccia sorocarpa TaxID=122646 RepID=A0ABD3I3L3_9MARC
MAGVVTAVGAAGAAVASLRQFDGCQRVPSSKVFLVPSRVGRSGITGGVSQRGFKTVDAKRRGGKFEKSDSPLPPLLEFQRAKLKTE